MSSLQGGVPAVMAVLESRESMETKRETKTVVIGPVAISRYRWRKFKRAIHQAFEEWDAWSGLQGDWEERDRYHAMVEGHRARVEALIAELEKA
jgi:hypothetical protein